MIVFRLSIGIGFVGYILLLLNFTGGGLLQDTVLGPASALTGGCAGGRASRRSIVV